MREIIAEDRKFGLCLGLITQFVGQFQPWLVSSVRELVGTILTCNQGSESAGTVREMTAGAFSKEYLQTLPERVLAVYTKNKNDEGRNVIKTFTAKSEAPYLYHPSGKIAKYKSSEDIEAREWALQKCKELQARDGTHVDIIDDELNGITRNPTIHQQFASQQAAAASEEKEDESNSDAPDELYDDAVRLVRESNQASVSLLQQHLRLGYTRAARLIDQMEAAGVVGPYQGNSPREVKQPRTPPAFKTKREPPVFSLGMKKAEPPSTPPAADKEPAAQQRTAVQPVNPTKNRVEAYEDHDEPDPESKMKVKFRI
jgi:hypothetical protein